MRTLKEIKQSLFPPESKVRTSNLLESPRTVTAHIEFTSRCNLRCVFCYASQPDYKGHDLDSGILDNAIDVLKHRSVKVLSVNGHGETTIYKNWHRYCNKMLDAGMPLHIISNFSKQFSEEEVETLSHFDSIEVSCDSSDPEIFGRLRRGADLKTIALNILRLRAKALKDKRPAPKISLSCVVSDQNVLALKDYVAFGKSLGIKLFNFCNLTKYPDIEGIQNANHITEMPPEQLKLAETTLKEAFGFLDEERLEYKVQQGLLDTLADKIQTLKESPGVPTEPEPKHQQKQEPATPDTAEPAEQPGEEDGGAEAAPPAEPVTEPESSEPHRYASDGGQTPTKTRDCLDPWNFILVQANNDVLPCCWHKPIFSLGKGQNLRDVFNSRRIKELRKNLLTGHLPVDCRNCPSRGWTSIDDLKKKVWAYLNPGIYKFFMPKSLDMTMEEIVEMELEYGDGWYDRETDANLPEPDWQSWRWASRKAVCKFDNPKQETILIVRGSVDKALFPEQSVTFTLNGKKLDNFIPGTAKFYKEYTLTPQLLGEDDRLTLTIETDKAFVPAEQNPGTADNRQLGLQVYQLLVGREEKKNNNR